MYPFQSNDCVKYNKRIVIYLLHVLIKNYIIIIFEWVCEVIALKMYWLQIYYLMQ